MIVSMKINNSTIKKKKVKIQLTTTAIYLYLVSDGVVELCLHCPKESAQT